MHWILKSLHFLRFLDIEEKVRVFPNPPSILYQMANAEFPIVQSLIVSNRSLMIHVTGPKAPEGMLSNVVNKVSWLFLGTAPTTTSTTESRGTVLVMKEDNSETNTYSVKTQIALNDIVRRANISQPVPATTKAAVCYLSGSRQATSSVTY